MAVGKPLHPQTGDQRALADALGTGKHQDIVKFAARIEGPHHRSAEGLLRDSADVGRIRGPQIVDQQRLHPSLAVPVRVVEQIAADRVPAALIRQVHHGREVEMDREMAVFFIHIAYQRGVVLFPPGTRPGPPGQRPIGLEAAGKQIVADAAQGRVPLQNAAEIGVAVFDASELVPLQNVQPEDVVSKLVIELRLRLANQLLVPRFSLFRIDGLADLLFDHKLRFVLHKIPPVLSILYLRKLLLLILYHICV